MQNRQPQNLNGLVDRQGEFTEGQPSRAPVMQNRQPQNPNGLVDRQGDFTEGNPSRAPVMQNRQTQKEEKPKGDNSAQQEVKQTIIRSPRDEMASSTLASEEGKLPPKRKMNEERHQEQIQSKVVASYDNDSVTSSSSAGPDNSGSDLIDLSYLEPPPPVYHSERIPRGQLEKNRLTKSDDSLGSHLLASHLQSDVEPQDFVSESVGNVNVKNHKKVKFDKPVETGSQKTPHPYPAPNSQTATGVTDSGVKVQEEILIDINDRFPSDFLSDVLTRAMAEDGLGMVVLPQDGGGMSMNIANHEPKHWSFFQKLAGDEFRQKDVSLIDQDHLAFLSRLQNVQEEASVGYNASQFPDDVDSRNTFIEDEGKEIPGSESTSMQPHYNPSHKSIEGIQFDDPSENTRMPDSEYKVSTRNDGVPSIDLSLGDVDICSLHIIRNEYLEELRELGSVTFVTVYHGKWRGTDVAIKRIKKSCFTGRSSEQERLTIEFWREANILLKLHHPNVMAFYGVVQDGPGGMLATVTEFMGDGSLRHVLLRKDRLFALKRVTYVQVTGGIVNNTLRPTILSDCDPEWTRLMELCWAPDPLLPEFVISKVDYLMHTGAARYDLVLFFGRVIGDSMPPLSERDNVPALGCTSTFIVDLADAVIEALPSATAMTPFTSERSSFSQDPFKFAIKMLLGLSRRV
ncbi:serine/threonine-protein kinase EDR1-like protein [Tanacetum coccineum]